MSITSNYPDKFIQLEKVIFIFMGLLKKLDSRLLYIWDGEVLIFLSWIN